MFWNIIFSVMSAMWIIAGIVKRDPSIWGLAIIMFWINIEILEIKIQLQDEE